MTAAVTTLNPEIYTKRSDTIANRKRHYETIFILAPGTDEKIVTTLTEKYSSTLETLGSGILRKDDWGKMKLAHEIEKHGQGRYFYYRYIATAAAVLELERNLKLEVAVLRFLTVRLSEVLSEAEQEDLKQRAAKEPSTPPNQQRADEYSDFD